MTSFYLSSKSDNERHICFTCSMPECEPASVLCPLNRKLTESETGVRSKVFFELKKKQEMKETRKELRAEINRVVNMWKNTDDDNNKRKAKNEITRLKAIEKDLTKKILNLSAEKLADRYGLTPSIVNKMNRGR